MESNILSDILRGLNDKQLEAAEHTEGPLLILAGAGSGKTRVLTHRIGYLIEKGVMPWQILAITFTNKAAGEMRERVDGLLSGKGVDVFVSTFHSLCVTILRRDIDKLGYGRDFTIYDTDDQRTLMREVIKALNLDTKTYRERGVLSFISNRKNEMIGPEEYAKTAMDFYERNQAAIYAEYQKRLKKNNAVDFDDLLILTVKLFKEFPEVLMGWQERFHYIMVDEYQDTNSVQFELVRMLSAKYRNLCVVGDDDQSIYKFRGADIENILSFERSFPGAKVVKLEQNYRSTKSILEAANEVIKNNKGRKPKKLWTGNENGELPTFREYPDARAEAEGVASEVLDGKFAYKDQAVLYRTRNQSRIFNDIFAIKGIPYRIIGDVNFYQRREVKDILAYLRLISNDVDDLSLTRIINVPKRGIGQTTVESLSNLSMERGLSMYKAIDAIENKASASSKKLTLFKELIEHFKDRIKNEGITIGELVSEIRDETGYTEYLMSEGEIEGKTRLESIDELINAAEEFRTKQEGDTATKQTEEELLALFLEDLSLKSSVDNIDDSENVVTLMTLHAAKGLEFDRVFLCGMEEGLFPSAASINSDDPEEEIEEERRLCYVGITRARKVLRMSSAAERMVNGEMRYCRVSRFIDEIPDECLMKIMRKRRAASWEDEDDDYDNPIPKAGFKKKNAFAESFGGFGPSKGYGSGGFGGYGEFQRGRESSLIGSGKVGSAGGRSRIIGAYGSLDKSDPGKRRGAAGGSLMKGLSKGMPQMGKPDYAVGDRVSHIKFGEGTVLDIKEGSKDYEVTVDFDEGGVRRMFAAFAKLKKL